MEKFTPLAKNFTLLPALTGWTNSTSVHDHQSYCTPGTDSLEESRLKYLELVNLLGFRNVDWNLNTCLCQQMFSIPTIMQLYQNLEFRLLTIENIARISLSLSLSLPLSLSLSLFSSFSLSQNLNSCKEMIVNGEQDSAFYQQRSR